MSLRGGGREAVEDTETEEDRIYEVVFESLISTWPSSDEGYMTDELTEALKKNGYVIVKAEDALTAEQRAAIGFVIRCLKEVCCDVESPHYLNEEGAAIALRVEAIAAGGQG